MAYYDGRPPRRCAEYKKPRQAARPLRGYKKRAAACPIGNHPGAARHPSKEGNLFISAQPIKVKSAVVEGFKFPS